MIKSKICRLGGDLAFMMPLRIKASVNIYHALTEAMAKRTIKANQMAESKQ